MGGKTKGGRYLLLRPSPLGYAEAADASPGMVSVLYFNQAECTRSFSSGHPCAFNLTLLPSKKCLSRKEAKEKVEKRRRG